jgi:hypothetical protein
VRNPFRATFGVSPPFLAGRDAVLAEFDGALADGPGASGRAMLFTGARGAGKTVLLNAVEDRARGRGWLVISETANAGFVERLTTQHLPRLLREFDPATARSRLSSVSLPMGLGGAAWERIETHVAGGGLREQIALLTDLLAPHETGLLITLDEIHRDATAELREFATTIQHGFREERQLAFIAAGLASAVSDVLNDDVLTFLRRADRHTLNAVGPQDALRALAEPIRQAGRTVSDEALEVMVEGSEGYPFLIQLVGERAWRVHSEERGISVEDARVGVVRGREQLGILVHAPALARISEVDGSFLLAMTEDEGPSKMADIQARLGVDVNYASQYRLRLIDAELIEAARRGYVRFTLPYLRDYLRAESV